MSQKKIILHGAFFLTVAGIIGRIISFFYRIFLSRIIGAEGIGIYQLVFPLYALTCSITSSGIQTSISRSVAARTAANDTKGAVRIFQFGLILSLSLSICIAFILCLFHQTLAVHFVKEENTAELLRILAFSLPFSAIHACINGYYFGLKQTKIPSLIQILETIFRFGSVVLIYKIFNSQNLPITPVIAVYGIVIEEFISAALSATALALHFSADKFISNASNRTAMSSLFYWHELLSTAMSLTLNRVLINLLQSLEAMLIPIQLRACQMSSGDALRLYGILTGMSLPLILFPTAITSSVSTMLLPVISEAHTKKNRSQIIRTTRTTCGFFFILGIFCWIFFLLFGKTAGHLLFHSTDAGTYIQLLAWLCPLLYLTPALASILNGLGKTGHVFLCSTTAILIRIFFVIFFIPRFGIYGYLLGLLAAQIWMSLCYTFFLFRP